MKTEMQMSTGSFSNKPFTNKQQGRFWHPDWFVASLYTMKPAIEAKRKALLEFKSRPNVKTRARYRESRSLPQRTARQAHNLYYVGLSEDIETAAKTGNLKSTYGGIKNSYRPHYKENSASQIERWRHTNKKSRPNESMD